MADILKLDLYGILEVGHEANEKEILKAYRKKALKCHPDKNPDNPKAADEFHQLSRALEILTDETARKAYDKALKAKKAAEIRHKQLDSKRKKFKEDLEARERQAEAASKQAQDVDVTKNLEAEIERLRKEGSKLLEQEQARLAEELKRSEPSPPPEEKDDRPAPRLKLKWKARKEDPENGGYSEEVLQTMFSKYGEVTALILSRKKNGSAIIEFESGHSAMSAVQHECGLTGNPLSLSWISGQPTAPPTMPASVPSTGPAAESPPSGQVPFQNPAMTSHERDYEDLVMMRMRQAQERKRLIEQMQKEEQESDT